MARPALISALAIIAVVGTGTAMAALPDRAASRLGLFSGQYDAAELLALDGAVRHGRLAVIKSIAGDKPDFDRLLGLATRNGHGSLQASALAP